LEWRYCGDHSGFNQRNAILVALGCVWLPILADFTFFPTMQPPKSVSQDVHAKRFHWLAAIGNTAEI